MSVAEDAPGMQLSMTQFDEGDEDWGKLLASDSVARGCGCADGLRIFHGGRQHTLVACAVRPAGRG